MLIKDWQKKEKALNLEFVQVSGGDKKPYYQMLKAIRLARLGNSELSANFGI